MKDNSYDNINVYILRIISQRMTTYGMLSCDLFFLNDVIWEDNDRGSCEVQVIAFVLIFLSNDTLQCVSRSLFSFKTL